MSFPINNNSPLADYGTVSQKQLNVKEQVVFKNSNTDYTVKVQDASQNGTLSLPSLTGGSNKTLDVDDSIIGMSRIDDDTITNAKLQTIIEDNLVSHSALNVNGASAETTLVNSHNFLISDASGVKKKVSFQTINAQITPAANSVSVDSIQNGSAHQLIQCDASGAPAYVSIGGDMTLQGGQSTIANDAITSAKLADQSAINVANNGELIFKNSTGDQWKLNVSSNKFQISYYDGSAWEVKMDIAN